MNTIDLIKQALERIEADWHQIDGEWGPTAGGLEEEIARGVETLIPALREAIAQEEARALEPVAVPQGWKLVPIEPTREMVQACDAKFVPRIALPFFVAAYKTMLAAAPHPPQTNSPS